VLVRPGPTHPGFDVDTSPVFQKELHGVLVTENMMELFINKKWLLQVCKHEPLEKNTSSQRR
jgi:hypothetical protein